MSNKYQDLDPNDDIPEYGDIDYMSNCQENGCGGDCECEQAGYGAGYKDGLEEGNAAIDDAVDNAIELALIDIMKILEGLNLSKETLTKIEKVLSY